MRISQVSLLAATASVAFSGLARAQGDDCTGALSIGQGLNGPYTNVGSTTSAPAWPCGAGANDVWFSYVPPSAGTLDVDLCTGTTYDSTLQVFDGTAGCGGLVSLGCNDDSCGLASRLLGIPVTGGTTYFIRVGGFGGGTGTFSVNINGPTGLQMATVVSQGPGCVAQYASFYEYFGTAAAFDLANTAITLTSTGSGYVVLPGGTYNAVGSLSAPVTLALTDDSQVAAGTLGLTVGSNGWVATAGGNTNAFTPNVGTFLSNPATAFYCWHDYNPAIVAGGQVKYEESGTQAQITWDGVWDFGGATAANANFLQFQINTATGTCTIAWGVTSVLGNPFLVGYSPGGANLNPGNSDLTTALPIITYASDTAPLALAAIGRPVQGAAAVAFNVTTSNIPAGALAHVGILGLARPGLDLGLLIGATGCWLNASLDVTLGASFLPPSSVTWTALNLPAAPPFFLGFQFNVQGAVLGVAANPALGLGVLTSNGLKCTVGDF
ncbi:MAG: hypothetical protein WAT39_09025 [Planctomycetota bacterium]